MIEPASPNGFRWKTIPHAALSYMRERMGIGYVWVGAVLALGASLPALFAREVFGDDWSVYYTYWTEGLPGLFRVLYEAAHAGFIVPMSLLVVLLPDMPDVAARLAGLGCHLANGVLLYSILQRSPYTKPIAALFAALFLLSPFYVIRLTQNAVYDVFLLFYLLSYELTYSKVRALRWAAPFCLFFSLSLETLIALEPLRVVLARSPGERWTRTLARLAPFWLAVATIIVLRMTILGKSGHYAGQYSFVSDPVVIRKALVAHFMAFRTGLEYAYSHGFGLLGSRNSTVLALAAMVGSALLSASAFWTPWLLRSLVSSANAMLLLVLGAAIALLGAMPYAITGIYGAVMRGESRLLFPSQVGVLLLMATFIQLVPGARLRAGLAGGLLTVFALSMVQDSKRLLYDGLINSDLQRQVRAALLADPEPKVVRLHIEDPHMISYRSRCLGAPDMNVAQMMLRDENRERSFVYTDHCGDFDSSGAIRNDACTVSYLEFFPCPPRRETWRYRAAPGIRPPDRIRFLELMRAVLEDAPSATQGRGELVQLKDNLPIPLARAEYRPPCRRPGVRGTAWLLALPTPSCEESGLGAR
ncbi:hypothetical protein WI560_18905 [Bradyrhizobium sp. A11]|uniref:hypothetical protein n=1 Tax=Bradyrhizobium sp. A11 TaxID=3133974 RepID=UPI00324A7FFF